MSFSYYAVNIKCYVSVNRTKYVLDWPIVPNMWLVKIGTNIFEEEMVALEDAGFHL